MLRTVPFVFALAITPWLVPGEFTELGVISLFVLEWLIVIGLFVFILSVYCGLAVLFLCAFRPQSDWAPKFSLWQIRFGLLFLGAFVAPWILTMSFVWLRAVL